jgi:hypothetical protein
MDSLSDSFMLGRLAAVAIYHNHCIGGVLSEISRYECTLSRTPEEIHRICIAIIYPIVAPQRAFLDLVMYNTNFVQIRARPPGRLYPPFIAPRISTELYTRRGQKQDLARPCY